MWVLYNERTSCLRARVQARSFTHGKAAERAVLTYISNSVKTKKPIEYIYGKIEAKDFEKPSLFNGRSLENATTVNFINTQVFISYSIFDS